MSKKGNQGCFTRFKHDLLYSSEPLSSIAFQLCLNTAGEVGGEVF